MKKLMLVAACVSFMATAAFAQDKTMSGTQTGKTPKSATKYYCPKCMAASDKPGTCSKCNMKLVKQGDYYCPGCGASSSKPGKCAKCNMDMKKMEGKS